MQFPKRKRPKEGVNGSFSSGRSPTLLLNAYIR